MLGNSIGAAFRVTTFGESHGVAVGCVVDGCPPGLALSADDLRRDLDRRRPGRNKHVTQRRETDEAEMLSGVFEGRTTGAPIAVLIRNVDARSRDYEELRDKFRPGHADFSWWKKYGVRDHRGGGRSSARETAARVAAGGVARKWLAETSGVCIRGCLARMGGVAVPFESWEAVEESEFFAPCKGAEEKLAARIEELRRAGDSCGAIVRVCAEGVPAGWGAPVFDRLDADIAKALMSINAVKGVEIGAGFRAAEMRGSENGDEMTAEEGFLSNNAGGVLGGVSSGQDIEARIAIKPTSSIRKEMRTTTTGGENATVSTTGRHDPCVGIRAVPVAEAMVAIVLMDHALRQRGQCGAVDSGR